MLVTTPVKPIKTSKCIAVVSKHFGLTHRSLKVGIRAVGYYGLPNKLLALMLKEVAMLSYPAIARIMGRQSKSHSGIMYLCREARQLIKIDPDVSRTYEALLREARREGS